MKKPGSIALILTVAALAAPSAAAVTGASTITTVAGTGMGGFGGDGGNATAATLSAPRAVAVDSQGNVYVADQANNRVREISGATITTIAGTGTGGFSGDGGPATAAELNRPAGVAVDGAGDVYVADTNNQRIRRISAGTITTVAGTGTPGFSGDDGPAAAAQLQYPFGVAVDAQENIYIADTFNNRVREVSSGAIITIAGTSTPGFSGDGGPAMSAQLDFPTAIAVDANGDVYIADSSNNRVREITGRGSGGTITTIAGNGAGGYSGDLGPATSAELFVPYAVAIDDRGGVYISDAGNSVVRKIVAGTITTIAGGHPGPAGGDGGPAINSSLFSPKGIGLDAHDDLYIAEFGADRVRKIANDPPAALFAATPPGGQSPLQVSFDASDSHDADGSISAYTWGFGDGTTASGKMTTHTYTHAGAFTATLTVTDDAGFSSAATRTITVNGPAVTPPDSAPTASFMVTPAGGAAPLRVRFDGAASSDPDGRIANYAWKFGDGATGNGATTSHRYVRAGRFIAQLTVTDDAGATATATRIVALRAASAPTLVVRVPRGQRLLAQHGLRLRASYNEPCALTATGAVTIVGIRQALPLTRARVRRAAGRRTVTLRVPIATRERLGRLLRPGHPARATIQVRAVDSSGRAALVTLSVAVR